MNLSDLLRENRLKAIKPDRQQSIDCLDAAMRDLATAKALIGRDDDWAFSIAYNSMLQCVRALMFAEGFLAVGEAHHKTIVDYAEVKLGAKFRDNVESFEAMRKKRHHVVYDKRGVISEYEARNAVRIAGEFPLMIRQKLRLD